MILTSFYIFLFCRYNQCLLIARACFLISIVSYKVIERPAVDQPPALYVITYPDDAVADVKMKDEDSFSASVSGSIKSNPPASNLKDTKKSIPPAPKSYNSWTSTLLEVGLSALKAVSFPPVQSSLQAAAAKIPSSAIDEFDEMFDELDDQPGEEGMFLNYHVGAEDIRDMYFSDEVKNEVKNDNNFKSEDKTNNFPDFRIENKNLRRRLNTFTQFMRAEEDKDL
jgi:hypothetical protein